MERLILIRVPARTAIEIPPHAGPGGRRGWHDVVYRVLDLGLGRANPRARASLTWRLDPEIYRGVREILAAFVHPGDTVLDIGASWGLFTYRLARAVRPGGRVVAFEPNRLLLPSLGSIARHYPEVTVTAVALSDAPGRAKLKVPTLSRPGLRPRAIHPMASLTVPDNRTDAAHETIEVDVARLDDAVGPAGPVSFVKCDVEGHELAVLRGAESVLAGRPAILIEIEQRHQDQPIELIFEHLVARGYEGHVLRDGRLSPLADFDVQRDQIAHLRPHAVFTAAPPGYVNNFFFVAEGTDVSGLIGSR